MAEFLEERLPIDVRMGASYGDGYQVTITETAGGAEYRKLVHPFPRRRWSINFTLLRDDLASRVLALYHRADGTLAGFRVRCHDDYSTAADGRSAPNELDQTLTRLSSGVYQLRKEYGSGATPLGIGRPARILYKPVAGTVLIAVNGTPKATGISVNTATGQVTISSPTPAALDVVTGGCEFDIPARFNSDIEITALSDRVRDCGSIELVELLQP